MFLSRHSTNLFQRLSLDESLRRTVAVYCTGWAVFTQIGVVTVTVQATVWALLLLVLRPAFGIDHPEQMQDQNYFLEHLGGFYVLMICNMVWNLVIGAVFHGAMIRVVADIYLQRQASAMECLQLGARHACTIMGSSFLVMMMIMVGLLLFVVPGMYLSVMFFVVNPAIVIEGLGIFGSLKRSYNLVSGSWCYVFCMQMIAMIFMMVVQMIWGAIFTGGNDAGHTLFSFVGSIIAAVPGIIFIPVFACMMTIMYINLRVEKEAVTAEKLAENLASSSGNTELYDVLLTNDEEQAEAPLV